MGGSKMDIKTTVAGGMGPLKKALLAVALLTVVLLPIVLQGSGMAFLVRNIAVVGLYVLLALGLNIVVGYAGLLDLGYIAFYGMGAYVGVLAGDVMIKAFGESIGPWVYILVLPVAALAGALTGIALGTPVLRLRGDYLAIVTLGFGEIIRIALVNNAFGLTNGTAGLPKRDMIIPDPPFFDWLKTNVRFEIEALDFSFKVTPSVYWFYVIFLLCILAVFVVRRLDDSRLGRSWVAMREDEVAAASVGVNIMTTKLWAFSLGALWGGIAGLTFASYQQFVSPESFVFMESVFVVCIVVLGGMGSIPGVIVGALIIMGLPETIRGLAVAGVIEMSAEAQSAVSNYRYLIFGLLMVIMMAVRPQGFIPSQRRAMELKPETEDILEEENLTEWEAENKHETPQAL